MSKESGAADIIARRGIYYQAFGIYKGLSGFYDYGPIGLRIKRKIEDLWRSVFVNRIGSLEIETTNILSEKVLEASGHVSTFTDFITSCEVCKTPYKADKLLEEYYEKTKMPDEASKVKKMGAEQLEKLIDKLKIRCERCGNGLGKVEKFNLLFKTQVGPYGGEVAFLRPETAQGIYLDFRNLTKVHGLTLPTGIAQLGKAYRNEISPRQHLVRMREFNQMELQWFFDPEIVPKELGGIELRSEVARLKIPFLASDAERAEERSIGDLVKENRVPNWEFAGMLYLAYDFIVRMGLEKDFRFREVGEQERAHYAKVAFDLEINTSYGYTEIGGTHYRTDYDLSAHAKASGEDISMLSKGRKMVPHVVESSWGTDRLLFALLDKCFVEDKDRGWNWLRLKESVAPYRYAVFPLQKDDKLIEKASDIHRKMVGKNADCYYSETASIGKRYAKADEIGVPHCITIDYQTLEDDTVTIRSRDTTEQVRKPSARIV